MFQTHQNWLLGFGYALALSCVWYNAFAHVQNYAESVEYAGPQGSKYRNQYENKNQRPIYSDGRSQTGRQAYNNRASNYEFEQGTQQQINPQRGHAGIMRQNEALAQDNQNKCRIWVPIETVDKYELAHTIQVDQKNRQTLIVICCAGYAPILWRGEISCRPICENCLNGFCRAPGECQCFEEYVKNDNDDCVFTCPLGCLNGRCYLDGSCLCDPGYKLDETRKYCRPICSAGCGSNNRHNCTEPEVCGCAKGYQLTDLGCQPVCEPDCGIGGICQENNICECGQGYTEKNGVCQSDCYQKCDNGICVSRNRCICNPGYTYHERSTQCVPN